MIYKRKNRASEKGNIFFTLFGAVAIVGVLGASIMATMRGPLKTMVNVNRRAQAEAQMQLSAKLALYEASEQASSGDCEAGAPTNAADGYVEPVPWKAAAGNGPDGVAGSEGGGFIPDSFGVTKQDPWGTQYGYCVWDAGTSVDDAACGGAGQLRLPGNGLDDRTYTVIAIISAGPDMTFQTGCVSHATADNNSDGDLADAGDDELVARTPGSDDVIFEYTYDDARGVTGGLWSLKVGDAGTATIDKEIEVSEEARFTGGIDMTTSSAALQLGAASMIFPDQATLATCNLANVGLVRINKTTDPDSFEICDDASDSGAGAFTWQSVAAGASVGLWKNDGPGAGTGEIYYNAGFAGIGTNDPDDALDVVGTIGLTENLEMANTKSVVWTSGASITESSGGLTVNANGGTGVELTLGATTATFIADTTITGSTTGVTAVDALTVKDSVANNLFVVQNDGNVGIGTASPDDALSVTGNVDTTTNYKIDNNVVLKSDTTMSNSIMLGNAAGSAVSGNGNTILGGGAAATLTTGTNNIVIGTGVDVPLAATSSYLNIGDVIHGDITGKRIGIGHPNTQAVAGFDNALEVEGTVDATNDLNADDDVIAGDDVVATGNFLIGAVIFGPPSECDPDEKLEWDDTGGWTCVNDLQGGSGGSGQTLEEVLQTGNDANGETAIDLGGVAIGSGTLSTGGTQDLELDVTGDIGATNYCDASGNNCFTAATVGTVPADSLDYDDFEDAMDLDASTTITADNAEILSIINTGTANSFVVMDQAADGTPFVIDPDGRVGIADPTPDGTLLLDVEGQIGALEYCDEDGNNCFDYTDILAGISQAIDDLTDAVKDTTAQHNMVLGTELAITAGATGNLFIGESSGTAGTTNTADNNVAIGYQSLDALTTGSANTALGVASLSAIDSGASNVAIGYQAMNLGNTSTNNVGIGYQALRDTGNNNVAIGWAALTQNLGNDNVAIGYSSGNSLTAGFGNILLGFNVQAATATTSNFLNIGDSIYGDLANDNIRIGGTGAVGAGPLVANPPATQTIAAAGTITANACGTVKAIDSAGVVTTDTTNTITAPAAAYNGCCMDLVNVGSNNITLDSNANFITSTGSDVVLAGGDSTRICGTATAWYQSEDMVSFSIAADTLDYDDFVDAMALDASTSITADNAEVLSIVNTGTGDSFVVMDQAADASPFTIQDDGDVSIGGDLTISGDDLFMNTNTSGHVLVADGTNFNPVAMSGDVTIASTGATTIGADKITEPMLKSVNAVTDEYCLTAETTTGDFEWQPCLGSLALYINDLLDAVTDYTVDHNMRLGSNTAMFAGAERNLFIGENAGTAGTSNAADQNIAIGYQALNALTVGPNNIAIGVGALTSSTSAGENTAIGHGALQGQTSGGYRNVAVGNGAAYTNSIGYENTVIGWAALNIGAGVQNTVVGKGAMVNGGTGDENTAIGLHAMQENTGNQNTALGAWALDGNTAGTGHTAIGYGALGGVIAGGTQNTALGYQAGDNITTGDQNIIIGYNVDAPSATGDSQLNIGDTIYGDLANDHIRIGGSGAVGAGPFIAAPPATQTIAATNTITANACGTVKPIDSAGTVTTNTTNTFTTPAAAYAGCCMDVVNVGSNNIILDANANFVTGTGTDITLAAGKAIRVCGTATTWYQDAPTSAVSAGSVPISGLTAAAAINSIDNTNYAQTWDWSTISTQTALAITNSGTTLTSGKLLNVTSAGTAMTGTMLNLDLTGSNAANTGTVLKSSITGASSTGTPLMVTNLGAGLSMRVNDATGDADTSPFVIDAAGLVGIGTSTPDSTLDLANGGLVFTNTGMTTPMTGVGITAETGGLIESGGAGGSFFVKGFSAADVTPLIVRGYYGIADPTDTTPAILLQSIKSDGGTGTAAMGNAETAFQVRNSSNNGITMLGNGYVGIMSTAPESLLEVQGAEATDAVIDLDADDGDDAADTWFIKSLATGNSLAFYNDATKYLDLNATQKLVVTPPSTETIAAAGTITANACGTIKPIDAGSSVTTNTTNTFTAPAAANAGCCMIITNVDTADTITLDSNANFITGAGTDIAVTPGDGVQVCSNGTTWYQGNALSSLTLSGSSIDGLSDAVTDYVTDHNMRLGSNTSMTAGAAGNLFIGESSGTAGTINADNNIALGYTALDALTDGKANIAMGVGALTAATTAEDNVAIGYQAGSTMIGALQNVAIGYRALRSGATGDNNVAIGAATLANNTANDNTALGHAALGTNTSGTRNTAVGASALNASDTVNDNTALGYNALLLATGGTNTAVGSLAGDSITTGTGNIVLGYNADTSAAGSSNELNIGGTIYGDLANDRIRIGGSGAVGAGPLLVQPPATEAIAGAGTITANACGSIKPIMVGTVGVNDGDVTTDTTNTFTAPAAANAGCCMEIVNVETGTDDITLDTNANFITGLGTNITISAGDAVKVCSNGSAWYQGAAVSSLAASVTPETIPINDLSDALYDTGADHNMRLGSNTAMTAGAAYNLFIGESAGTAGTSNAADYNIAMGYQALDALTTGLSNLAIGYQALTANTDAAHNTAIGYRVLSAQVSGYQNTAVGSNSMRLVTAGNNNTALGIDTLSAAGNVSGNVAIGVGTLNALTSNGNNIAIGMDALGAATDSNGQIAIGHEALFTAATATGNTAVGYQALKDNQDTGLLNTAVGYQALTDNTTAVQNTAVGYQAMQLMQTGINNTAVGVYAMQNGTSGDYNTAFGRGSLRSNSGSNNTAVGQNALTVNTTGSSNAALGQGALRDNDDGSGSTAVGYHALLVQTTGGTQNTALGYQAGDSITTGDGNIMIGYDVDASAATVNNELNIGGTIYGDLANDRIRIGGSGAVGAGPLLVQPPATETIAAAATITANACGTIKPIDAGSSVTTNTTNTFTAPAAGNAGCCMIITNVDTADTITLDTNANFITGTGSDIAVTPGDGVQVCSNGTTWYQGNALSSLAAGVTTVKIDDLTDATYDPAGDHNMRLGSNTAMTAGAAGNLFIGDGAGTAGTTNAADYNIALGYAPLDSLTTGARNVAIGFSSLSAIATTNDNIGIGYNTQLQATGGNNISIGSNSMGGASLTGSNNVGLGSNTLENSTGSDDSTAIGYMAMRQNTTGDYNTALGSNALYANKAKRYSTAVGAYAMYYADDSTVIADTNNTAVGYQALMGSTTAANNIGTGNTALGAYAIDAITSGSSNTGVGVHALGATTSGGTNTAVGYQALMTNVNDNDNTAVGYNALAYATATGNTALGYAALAATPGGNNVAIGKNAGVAMNDPAASGNVLVGYQAGNSLTTGGSNLLIGYDVDTPAATTSSFLNIGDSIFGDLANDRIRIGGSGAVSAGPLLVQPPATETIAGAGTITANACGTIKPIDAGSSVTTNTTNTFTAPAAGNAGCCMIITNVDTADTITLDANANFITGVGSDIAVGPGDGVQVCSNGTTWYQGNALSSLASSGSSIDGLSDAVADYVTGHNMRIGSNTSMTAGAAGNVFVGDTAGTAGTTNSDNNVAIGYTALDALTDGDGNIAIGTDALGATTWGTDNIGIGYQAGLNNTTGADGIAIGNQAEIGGGSISMGYRAKGNGTGNIVMGYNARRDGSAGNYNIALGYETMLTTGASADNNVALGYNALAGSNADNNIAIGYQAGNLLTTGASNILIGYDADTPLNSTSNFLNIGDSIYGDLANDRIRIGGSGAVSAGPFLVEPPATEVIAAAATITANACGTIKPISAASSVTTNTTDTFTTPAAANAGCCMIITNVDTADTITLDANANFITGVGSDIAVGPGDGVQVCSNGTTWYQGNALSSLASGASSVALSDITDATGNNTTTNASNNQIWNWQLSGDEHAFTIGETAASSGGTNQILLVAKTLATSTAVPFAIENLGNNISFAVSDVATDTTPFVIDANGNVGISTATPHGALELGGDGDSAVGAASLTLGRGGDIGFNSYEAGGPVDRYLYTTGSAFKVVQDTGSDVLVFKAGGSGTAGNDITYTNAMTIGSTGNVRVGSGSGAVGTGPFVVTPPATEVIAGAATITANACGTIKPISAGSSVTTNTTNTFTAPAAANAGCCMIITNVDTVDTITLDTNANFITGTGSDIAVGPGDGVQVCSNGTTWYQGNALSSLASSGSSIDGLSDAVKDTSAQHNMILGTELTMTAGATQNLFIGESAGTAGTTNAADGNIAIGYQALDALTTGNSNTVVGAGAMSAATTNSESVAIGRGALALANGGDSNTAVGMNAISTGTAGQYNTAVGTSTLKALGSGGDRNSALGRNAGQGLTDGNENVLAGDNVMYNSTNGDQNVALGAAALYNANSNNNIAIGFQAGDLLTTGGSNIIIGYDADAPANNTSNFLNIGDSIYGDLANDRIRIGGSGAVSAGPFLVQPPATETIAAAGTITANACGTIKPIDAGASVTTDTTNTFTAPAAANAGCCMIITNVDTADTITLDVNANFITGAGTDIAVGPGDGVQVCSNGTTWYQGNALSSLSSSASNVTDIQQNISFSGDITDAITANQNNYSPAGLATASVIRISADTHYRTITGLAGGSDGRTITFLNTGNNIIQFNDEDGSSTAANRFAIVNDYRIYLRNQQSVTFIYDATSSRWRKISLTGGNYTFWTNDADHAILNGTSNGLHIQNSGNDRLVFANITADFYSTWTSSPTVTVNGQDAMTSPVFVVANTTTTGNSTVEAMRLIHTDSNSAGANSIGTALTFWGETATASTNREQARIVGDFLSATDASKTGQLRFYTNSGSGAGTSLEIANMESTRKFVVKPPATETIAGAATITANACGTIKPIDAGSSVTTNTTNTFTAPAAANAGCCMIITNVDTADTITLDANANFITGVGSDIAVGPGDGVQVCSNGTTWYQGNALSSLASSGSSIDGLSDGATDYVNGNLWLGQNAGAAIAGGGIGNLALGQDAADAITTGDYNVAVGTGALGAVSTGSFNTAVGSGALAVNTSGSNTAIGSGAMYVNVTGGGNVAVGNATLYVDTWGANNTAIGSIAMTNNDGGSENVAVGGNAMRDSVSDDRNTIVGYAAGTTATQSNAVAIGHSALYQTSGDNNIGIGYQAGNGITSGASNIVIGYDVDAMSATGNSQLNIGDSIFGDLANDRIRIGGSGVVGAGPFLVQPPATEVIAGAATITANACGTIKAISAASSVTTNTTNTFTAPAAANAGCCMIITNVDTADTITLDANANFITGVGSDIAVGPGDGVQVCSNGTTWYQGNALSSLASAGSSIDGLSDATYDTGSDHNMRLGSNTAMTAGAAQNLFIGESAGTAGTSNAADANLAIGYTALDALTTGSVNMAIGPSSLSALTTSTRNVAIGSNALEVYNDTGGNGSNTAIGYTAMMNVQTGGANTVIGNQAMDNNSGTVTNVDGNTAVGSNNLRSNQGDNNVSIGYDTMHDNTTGRFNTAVGTSALNNNTDGQASTAVGMSALSGQIAGGQQNTALGYQAGDNITTGDNNIMIGFQVDAASATGNQQLNIGNAIYGTGIHGGTVLIGINNSAPETTLEVTGSVCVSDATGDTCTGAAAGAIMADGAVTANAFDVAERYASDTDLKPGTIVALDGARHLYINEASAKTTAPVLGIVSTDPGLVLGWENNEAFKEAKHVVLVALAGRVPLQVTGENGSIKIGDRIALSATVPGFGAKASDKTGTLVGIALENFNAADKNARGTVNVFVDTKDIADIRELRSEISSLKNSNADLQKTLANVADDIKGLKAHTGYGTSKAEMTLAMLAAIALAGAAFAAGAAVRRRKN